jgi:TonB family protein
MNKLTLTLLLLFLVLIGCSSRKEIIIAVDKKPELLNREPLPPFNGKWKTNKFTLETKLLISKKGNVEGVDLLSSSGDQIWDETAIKQIKNWKYSPAILAGDSIEVWIRQSIKISVIDNFKVHLAEIVCNSLMETDSVYFKIKDGIEFGVVAHQYSKSLSAKNLGDLGIVDIRNYSYTVQEQLAELAVNSISKPIKIADRYYIFKKLPSNNLK